MKKSDINLGDYARDTITGYTGTVVARTEWINGCVRYIVQSNQLKDGVPLEPQHVDSQQLEVVKKENPIPSPAKTGGPMPSAKRELNAQ